MVSLPISCSDVYFRRRWNFNFSYTEEDRYCQVAVVKVVVAEKSEVRVGGRRSCLGHKVLAPISLVEHSDFVAAFLGVEIVLVSVQAENKGTEDIYKVYAHFRSRCGEMHAYGDASASSHS